MCEQKYYEFRPQSGAEIKEGCETQKVVNTSSFHTTPNTSLGLVQATPSKAQPSPTVHTKEALGFIMNMFQAPTLPDISDDKEEWPSLSQNEFEAQFQKMHHLLGLGESIRSSLLCHLLFLYLKMETKKIMDYHS